MTALPELVLDDRQRADLAGQSGPAMALGMRMVVGLARLRGATRLIPIESAHLDGCLYQGRAGLDFAERLADLDAKVVVPTTLNVGSLDLLHPDLVRIDAATSAAAQRLMAAYTKLGAKPTWTCAPYQIGHRPAKGFARRVGGVERDRVLQLRARRPHRSVRRLPGHLRGRHRLGS